MDFSVSVQLSTSPQSAYSHWLSSEGHTAMTGGEAQASDRIGDPFTAWDGYISGVNLELEPFNRIVQRWRTTEFTDAEESSLVEVLFAESDGGCLLTLNHSRLPAHGAQYEQGWKDHYFTPMKEFFG